MFRTTFQPRMALWLGVLAACVPALALDAAEIHVPADYPTIQEAVNAASNGDEIIIAPGTYAGFTINDKTLTLRSSGGPEATILDGGGAQRVIMVQFSPMITLQGLTIANGQAANFGGGVWGGIGYPNIIIDDCIFLNNTATTDGGAIGGGWTNVVITNSSFIGNSAG